MMFPESFIAELVEFCERKNIYLITDDIYHKLVFDGKRAAPAYNFTTQGRRVEPKSSSSTAISKLYGMTGFRIGWAVAPRAIVEVMTNVQAQTTSCASAVLQAGAEGALTGMQSVVESLRLTHPEQPRRDDAGADRRFIGRAPPRPQGTFYCLPDFRAYNQNSVELSHVPAEEGAGRHRARQGVRHGGPPASQLLRRRQGHDGRGRAHQVGARPELAE